MVLSQLQLGSVNSSSWFREVSEKIFVRTTQIYENVGSLDKHLAMLILVSVDTCLPSEIFIGVTVVEKYRVL